MTNSMYYKPKSEIEKNDSNKLNIVHLFLDVAKQYPGTTAIIDSKTKISFRELENEVIGTAAYFQKKGISQGDRVLVFIPMSIDLYRTVLALFYIGAIPVFLDEWVNKKRLLLCCKLANCKGFIGTAKARLLGMFTKEIRHVPIKLSTKKRVNTKINVSKVNQNSSALITFTTGSTGTPKAADRTHGFLHAQFSVLKNKINPQVGDIDMPTLPIVLLINLGSGVTSIIADINSRKPEKMVPERLINQIEKQGIQRIISSPYFIKRIAEALLSKGETLSNLKTIYTGGAPVFPHDAALYRKAFPLVDIQIIYGSTEAEPISSICADQLLEDSFIEKNGLPVGRIHPETKLKIIDISEGPLTEFDISSMVCSEEMIGEIIVAGDHVLKQYFNNSEAYKQNKIVTKNQVWHRTGDSGFIKDGQLFLTGRCKQLIYNNGEVHSLFLIENQLQAVPGIVMGTLMKVKDDLVLIIEIESDTQINKSLLKGIPFDRYIKMKSIPRDPRHFSKIDYSQLSKLIQHQS